MTASDQLLLAVAQARAVDTPHSTASSATQPAAPPTLTGDGATIITRKLRPDGSGMEPGPRAPPTALGSAGPDSDIARMQDVLSDDDAPIRRALSTL